MKTSNVFSTFHSHKIPPLAFLGLLQTDDRFPYSFYTSLCFEQLSTSFPGVLGYFTLPRTIINLFSRVLRENPGNEVVEQSEWLTCGLITSSFASCLLPSGKIAQEQTSSLVRLVALKWVLSVTSVYDHEREFDKLGCFLPSSFDSFSYQRLVSAAKKK